MNHQNQEISGKTEIKTWKDLINDTENTWDYEDSLEESLFEADQMLEGIVLPDTWKTFKPGDIIMAQAVKSSESELTMNNPHRLYIISAVRDVNGIMMYQGYILTSQVQKSNKYSAAFPATLYIADYSSILAKGPAQHKEAAIEIQEVFEFTSEDLQEQGSWKGHVTQEFSDWVEYGINLYKNKQLMELLNYFWIK